MTDGALRLEDRGVKALQPQDRRNPDEREAHQPVAPAHAGGHGCPSARREDQVKLYLPRVELHNLPRPLPRYGDGRGGTPLPGSPHRDGGRAVIGQSGGHGTTLLLWHDPRSARARPASRPRALSEATTARAFTRGGRPISRGGARTRAEVQGCTQHRLWRGLEGRRSRDAARQRYRFKAHANPRRAGQGPQRPARDAVSTAARALARVVATVSLARLAVSGSRSGAA